MVCSSYYIMVFGEVFFLLSSGLGNMFISANCEVCVSFFSFFGGEGDQGIIHFAKGSLI